MKYIITALLVLLAPVAVSQELVIKKGKTYMVVTTTCETGSAPLKVDVERVKPGKTIRVYTVKGSQKCRIKTVKTLA
jgi:aconitase B